MRLLGSPSLLHSLIEDYCGRALEMNTFELHNSRDLNLDPNFCVLDPFNVFQSSKNTLKIRAAVDLGKDN